MKNFTLKSVFKSKSSNVHVHPLRDWMLLVAVFLLLVVLSAAWNAWLFLQVVNGKSLGSVPIQTTQPTAHTVTDVQNVFKSRAAERVHYQKDYQFIDPAKQGS